ncbi:MAG: ribulose-phosphate 3-epimerase, partial [Candidatus Kapabacteria bacterium]|nr:ribulose-phosphate 3-epimerase [Candidatus Kapabacteria bacterium]
LMVENPDSLIPEFAQLGSEYISFHIEAVRHIHRSISLIKSFGKKAGIALNPATPLEYAYSSAEFVDYILLMSVNPGFGGQEFIDNFYRRAVQLKEFLLRENLDVMIEVDGGVKIENAKRIVDAGADILVSGSGIFEGNIIENIKKIRSNII